MAARCQPFILLRERRGTNNHIIGDLFQRQTKPSQKIRLSFEACSCCNPSLIYALYFDSI